jgi:hypothetical protein
MRCIVLFMLEFVVTILYFRFLVKVNNLFRINLITVGNQLHPRSDFIGFQVRFELCNFQVHG